MIPPLDRLTRRVLLKRAGVTMLLPFLPSLSWADDPSAPAPKPPKRWATILFANGVHNGSWSASGEGEAMVLSKSLSPLTGLRGHFTTLDHLQLFDEDLRIEGPHTPFFTNFLSGVRLPSGSTVLGQSCDQLMARTIGQDTAVPSISLCGEPTPYGLENGHPTVISSTISWSSPTTPVTPQFSPRDAFDELFDTKGLAREKSVLDTMQADLVRMRAEVSPADRRKVEEFTEAVHELETRIARASAPPTGWRPTLTQPDMLRPAQSTAQALQLSLGVRHKLMMRIMTLAFHMDKTRIATLVLERDGSYINMGFVPGATNSGLHTLSHHSTAPESIAQFQATNEYHVSLLAGFMEKLKGIDEGGTTLLDNSMILFGSNVSDGHDCTRIPLILAGGGGGTLKPGRALSFEKLPERRLCNLHLALLQRMGVQVDGKPIQRFGNSIKPLEGI
jgi:hypothetical protein